MSVDQIAIEIQDRQDPSKSTILDRWESYSIKSSVWDPCDSFTVRPVPELYDQFLCGGQKVWIYCNATLQFTGITDEKSSTVSKDSRSLAISGRDMGALLVDAACEPQCLWNVTLKQLAERQCAPWLGQEIPSVDTDNAVNFYKLVGKKGRVQEKIVKVDGGLRLKKVRSAGIRGGKSSPYYRGVDQDRIRETWLQGTERRWDVIMAHAQRVACTSWFMADGSLFIGRPRYNDFPYKMSLNFKRDGSGNVLGARFTAASSERFSHYTFWASGRSGRASKGLSVINRSVEVSDWGDAFYRLDRNGNRVLRLYRPTAIAIRKGCSDHTLLRRIARGQAEWSIVQSYKYEVDVEGHSAPNGFLWEPDACIDVFDEVHGRYGPHYIVARSFKCDKNTGVSTTLQLIPTNLWLGVDHDTTSDSEWKDLISSRVDW